MTDHRTPFLTIRAEGALLPVDLLQRIVEVDRDLGGLTPESYHLSGEKLNEAINRSWNRLLGAWAAFQAGMEKLPGNDPGTSITREKWLLPLFDELDYGRLQTTRAIEIEGKSYSISHGWNEIPIHLVGFRADLDRRSAGVVGAAKASPHSLVQELLNRSPERLWGFVSNGLRLRVLRDNASLTRQAYLEFDLEAMMNGEVYSDFVVLWLLCHQSRIETRDGGNFCWLEQWSKAAQERGTRALEGLRGGVEKAIEALGKGFIGHPGNNQLRNALSSGSVSTLDLYRQLLRLVYRLIFLFVAEDRQLLYDPASDAESRERYARFYSTARLRRMAERVRGSRHADLYVALKLVMDKLGNGGAPELGLPALGGFLFSRKAMSVLVDCELSNEHLLEAVRSLAFTQDGRTRRAVDYKNLGVRELGSVYESLLELHPTVNANAGMFSLEVVSGSERKTTGSFFTAEDLIKVLLDSALDPVIQQAIARAGTSLENQIKAILNLRVCDPACGSGHFLVAAAHRLARVLAQLQTGEGEPAPEAMRSALRAVISNCIYGVDINPMSVELCKVSLWMEALEPGKPLSFLDAHIQCGDSLVGVSPNLDISEIPDEAFNPAFGDDKATASALKKRNKRERGGSHVDKAGQLGFRFEVTHMTSMDDLARWLAERAEQVDAMPEDDSTQVQAKAKAFDDLQTTSEYLKNRFELDLWTASFFWKISKADAESMLAPTQQELIQLRNGGELDSRMVERVKEISERLNFLHWALAFPKVFSGENPGFDCVLGNPPWERISMKEREFFSSVSEEISHESNTKVRRQLMADAFKQNSELEKNFGESKETSLRTKKFLSQSGRYPLTGVGDINTYALFPELFLTILNEQGHAGVITQTQLVTEKTYSGFLRHLIKEQKLVSCFAFENERFLFPAAHHSTRFVLMTIGGRNPTFTSATGIWTTEWLKQNERIYRLSANDISYLNPETGSIPQFRAQFDFFLAHKVYSVCEKLKNDTEFRSDISSSRVMHDTDDAAVMVWNREKAEQEKLLPVLESKLFDQYNHRLSTYDGVSSSDIKKGYPRDVEEKELVDFNFTVAPRKWVNIQDTPQRFAEYNKTWLLHIRKITNSIAFRTVVCAITSKLPNNGSAWWIRNDAFSIKDYLFLLAVLNSLPLDYFARQKVGGINLNSYHLNQFPIPLFPSETSEPLHSTLVNNAFELSYTASDLAGLAIDYGFIDERGQPRKPFSWDSERRSRLISENDAIVARLYGLTRDELRYILDPKEVHGEDFPGETFRVLKEKEIKQFGEYRTRRLVLDAWDRINK